MQHNVEKVLELSNKLCENCNHLHLNCIVHELFEIDASEIGEVVSERKKLKMFAKNVVTKTVRKQLVGGRKKYKRRTGGIRVIPRKNRSKEVALAKTFLTKQNECKRKSFSVQGFYKIFSGDF